MTAETQRGPRRVLLVEDEEDVRQAGAEWLRSNGYEVKTASSGEAAIAMLTADPPDVVVLDLMMPGVNGWDVWDWLRAGARTVPVVVWTATGLKTGAVGDATVVPKGRPEELLLALQRVFG